MALKRAAVTEETTVRTAQVSPEDKALMEQTRHEAEAQVETTAAGGDAGPSEEEKQAALKEQEALAAKQADADKAKAAAAEAEAETVESADPQAQASEPETKPVIEAEPVRKAVAPVQEGGAVVATQAEAAKNAMAAFGAEMAAEGFEGMELTGMSFDRLKMHEGKFQLGSEETDIGEVIFVQIMSTRSIYVVRQHDGQKAEMFYSYDPKGRTLSDGTSSHELLEKWKEDGYGVDDESPLQIKGYIEGMAQLVNRDDEYDHHMVSLSIPPASKSRLAGAFAVGRQRFGAKPADLVIKCTVGKKIGTGDEAFRPWVFNAHSIVGA